ncbi:hypothetical protein BJ138DRAFT_670559 [Hygrophoropsis aurantiaca]|uniref:Uncharacterized protein n=1 Tax=Hygrophoropsis aurantiaca TaxID=72124 RepID=A0ACB8AKV0_9AGAM|nr:hypothetical protein BJ138DRAFT_670559 [Hygrophoropsis aurantiaca]
MLVAYVSAPSYLYWMPFHLCKSKLYTNTMLAMLNSRGNDDTWSNVRTLQIRPSLLATMKISRPLVHENPMGNELSSTAAMTEGPAEQADSESLPPILHRSNSESRSPAVHAQSLI